MMMVFTCWDPPSSSPPANHALAGGAPCPLSTRRRRTAATPPPLPPLPGCLVPHTPAPTLMMRPGVVYDEPTCAEPGQLARGGPHHQDAPRPHVHPRRRKGGGVEEGHYGAHPVRDATARATAGCSGRQRRGQGGSRGSCPGQSRM